jgi:hypothetical protein
MNTIFGLGGIIYLIVGIKATNAIIIPEIDPTLSPMLVFWKNIPKFITAKIHKGKNIVAKYTDGYL